MRIYVAGVNGMVGSAIAFEANAQGLEVSGKSSKEIDLTDRKVVFEEIQRNKPEALIIAAAKVGGIMANNNYKADFLTENLQIQTNIIQQSYNFGVKKLLFLGSSCIYPKFATQPIREDQLMTGALEPTNDAYAIAKIVGIVMCQAYRQQHGFNAISLMPTNLYGPNDNFDLETSHVLPAMIAKFHNAMKNNESVTLWGDGSAMREFLHVDDLAEACYVCMQKYDEPEHINVGTGEDVRIWELASIISDVVAFSGEILWDFTKPNGTPRKVLNVDKIKSLGWKPKIGLHEGIGSTYNWYKENACK